MQTMLLQYNPAVTHLPLCRRLFSAAVLLGPLRAITYVLMHGMLAAALYSMWVCCQWPLGLADAVVHLHATLTTELQTALTLPVLQCFLVRCAQLCTC
jgi:hypothetical protein